MKSKNIFWGIIFLCSAGIIIAYQLGSFAQIGLASLLLTIALSFIIIKGILDINFFEILIPIAGILIIYSEQLGINNLTPWPIIIAAIFASIGLSLIFKKPKSKICQPSQQDDYIDKTESLNEDIIVSKTTFSSAAKYLYSKNLQRADFNVSFGALKVYFDQVELSPGGADINFEASFAGIELYIPSNWKIVNNISASIGGVDIKGLRKEADGPSIRLNGHVSFGGIEINYI